MTKSRIVSFRVTDAEHAELSGLAARAGVTVSDLVRRAVLDADETDLTEEDFDRMMSEGEPVDLTHLPETERREIAGRHRDEVVVDSAAPVEPVTFVVAHWHCRHVDISAGGVSISRPTVACGCIMEAA